MIGKSLVLLVVTVGLAFLSTIFYYGYRVGENAAERRIADRWYRHCVGLYRYPQFCRYELGYQLGIERNK